MKTKAALVLICLLILSCTQPLSHYTILDEPDAKQYIVNELSSKKIIFIGENHIVSNEEIFLAENLQDFYNAGVRYLFFEGNIPVLPESENYRFTCFFPWSDAGKKYELLILYQAIHNLNK